MNITLYKDRSYKKDYLENEGTSNENRATLLSFKFPEGFENYAKRIVFITPEGNYEDLIVNDTYTLTNAITKFESVDVYVKLTFENVDWRSKTFPLTFNENEEFDSEIPEEKIDELATILDQVNKTIDRIKEIEISIEDLEHLTQRVDVIEEKVENFNGRFDELDGKIDEVEELAKNNTTEINNTNQELNDVKTELNSLDTEVDRLTENVNNIAADVSRIDTKVNGIASDVETNKTEIRELEENINHLEDNKADRTEIPDVSQFITKAVDDLVNYYKKSEVNDLIGAIKTISMKVLPTKPEVGESNIIYLIPSSKTESENIYDEWIYVDNKWERIGSTQIDLSNYYTIEQINTILYDYITSNDLEEILKDYVLKTDIKVDNTTISKNNADEFQSIGNILKSGGYQNYWKGTKNEYNAIAEKDVNTLYEVLDDEETALFEVDGNTIEFSNDGILQIPAKNDMMFQSVTYGNHESGYRKWRNGYIEQWGVATTGANGETEFTMHQPHIDQNFSVFIEPREQGNFFHYAMPSANQKFKTRIQSRDGVSMAVRFQWRSYGYWK